MVINIEECSIKQLKELPLSDITLALRARKTPGKVAEFALSVETFMSSYNLDRQRSNALLLRLCKSGILERMTLRDKTVFFKAGNPMISKLKKIEARRAIQ